MLDALEAGDDPDVAQRLAQRRQERDELKRRLEVAEVAVRVAQAQDPARVVAQVREVGQAWQDRLENAPADEARQLLASIFPTGLTVTQVEEGNTIDSRYAGDVIVPGEAVEAGGKLWLPGLGSNQRLPD